MKIGMQPIPTINTEEALKQPSTLPIRLSIKTSKNISSQSK